MNAQDERPEIKVIVFNRPSQTFIPVWVTQELRDDEFAYKQYLESIRNRDLSK